MGPLSRQKGEDAKPGCLSVASDHLFNEDEIRSVEGPDASGG
jgi:hypothetical protein